MSHPDPCARPELRPIELGEVFENPVTRERAVILELPWQNQEGRAVAEMTAFPGARVVGEHLLPALHESFSVLRGELTGHVNAARVPRYLHEPLAHNARAQGDGRALRVTSSRSLAYLVR